MGLSKSVRFEVFARDGFTCQYCGRRPPDVVLECDHIHPQSKGGKNDLTNLITSCFDCNRGKSAKVISEVAPRPDADLAFLKTQQEIAEVQRFLEAKKRQDELNDQLCDALRDLWCQSLTPKNEPSNFLLLPWIAQYGAEEIAEAIKIATLPYLRGQFYGCDEFRKLVKYIGAVMRNRKKEPEKWGVDVSKDKEQSEVGTM
jgi:hypothetical protein